MSLKKFFRFALFSSSPPIVGIEIDSQLIRLAQIRIKKGKIKVEILRELPLNASKKLLEGISKGCWFSVLLPQRKVMVRTVVVKSAKVKDALQALEFELEPKLPFPIQNAIIQAKAEKIQKNEIDVTAYICEKQSIQDFLSHLKSKFLFADSLTCVADSLAHLCSYDPNQKDKENIIIHIGEEETSIILVKNGRVLAQQSYLTEDKQLSFSIQRTVLNFSNRYPNKIFSQIYLFGNKAPSFSALIHEVTKKNVHTLSLPTDLLSENEWRNFAAAIGAALSQVRDPINFRQKEFSSKYPYKRSLRPAILSICLSIFSAATLFCAKTMLDNKERAIHKTNLNSIFDFIKQDSAGLDGVTTPEEFQQIISRLSEQLRERNFESKKTPFRISEILHDFSQKIAMAEPPLHAAKILDFQWEIKKRATPSSPRVPFEIECKLALEVSSSCSKQAIQKLLSTSSFVNQSQDISINIQDKLVTVQFMLNKGDSHD